MILLPTYFVGYGWGRHPPRSLSALPTIYPPFSQKYLIPFEEDTIRLYRLLLYPSNTELLDFFPSFLEYFSTCLMNFLFATTVVILVGDFHVDGAIQ